MWGTKRVKPPDAGCDGQWVPYGWPATNLGSSTTTQKYKTKLKQFFFFFSMEGRKTLSDGEGFLNLLFFFLFFVFSFLFAVNILNWVERFNQNSCCRAGSSRKSRIIYLQYPRHQFFFFCHSFQLLSSMGGLYNVPTDCSQKHFACTSPSGFFRLSLAHN